MHSHRLLMPILVAVLLSGLAERATILASLSGPDKPGVSSQTMPAPLAVDRLRSPQSDGQDQQLVAFLADPAASCNRTSYGAAFVVSRERAFLDVVALTLHSGKVCLQV